MCDYSLHAEKTRPALVGDKLTTHRFSHGTVGMRDCAGFAVCLLPGTELAFASPIASKSFLGFFTGGHVYDHSVARFRKVDEHSVNMHHDALELPDGNVVKLHDMLEGQEATVLQLPAKEKDQREQLNKIAGVTQELAATLTIEFGGSRTTERIA